ncbi:hypothetical protein [Pseudolysinimonas sp.]
MAEEATYVVNYMVGSTHLPQDTDAGMAPFIGQGVHLEGVFYRAIDVWYNYESMAPVPHGIVAFLERVGEVPKPFEIAAPDYYAARSH